MANNIYKNKIKILELIIILQIVIMAIFANNYKLVLLLNGFNDKNTQLVYVGINDNNREYRVINRYHNSEVEEIAIFSKDILGIWHKTEQVSKQSDSLEIAWISVAGLQTYNETDINTIFEVHKVYCGNNATKRIPSLSEYMPKNSTVEILQSGESYSIHLTAYGNPEVLNSTSISDILFETGCIQ